MSLYQCLSLAVNLLGVGTAVLLVYIGFKEVTRLYSQHLEKEEEKLFNSYIRLLVGFEGLDSIITKESTPGKFLPTNILYRIWGKLELADKYPVSEDRVCLLRERLKLCLRILYRYPLWIPLKILDENKGEEWIQKLKNLIIEFNNLLEIVNISRFKQGGTFNEDQVKNQHEMIKNSMDYFHKYIKKEIDDYQQKKHKFYCAKNKMVGVK